MRRVLITGCSTGLGRALAEELTSRRFEVIATARNPAALDGVPAVERLALDVTSESSVTEAVGRAGRIDVLVNNAGRGFWGPTEVAPNADVNRLFEVNVFGPLRLIGAVAPQMRQRGEGLIMQVSSVRGRTSGPMLGAYAASKHALDAFSQALRVELGAWGVRVSIAEFGPVASSFGANRTTVAYGDYAALAESFEARMASAPRISTSAVDAARRLADAIADGGRSLRYEGTPGAFAAIERRLGQDDETWEAEASASWRGGS